MIFWKILSIAYTIFMIQAWLIHGGGGVKIHSENEKDYENRIQRVLSMCLISTGVQNSLL